MDSWFIIKSLVLICPLIWASVTDIRTRYVSAYVPIILISAGILFLILGKGIYFKDALYGAGLGFIISIIPSFLNKMGFADVQLFTSIGLWLGIFGIIDVFFLSAAYALIPGIVLVIREKNTKVEIPYVPFISAATITVWFTPFSFLISSM